MHAREPDRQGYVERDGVRVAWKEYGETARPEDPAVLLLPTWCIVTSDIWKLQVPFLSRRTRVITFDPRGNGRSDRPEDVAQYTREQLTGDALAVLDRTDTRRAMVVALSRGNEEALDLAGEHPERVVAWVAISPSIGGLGRHYAARARAFAEWEQDHGDDDGWGRYNRFSWVRDYSGFLDFFFHQLVPEAHSTKLIEDLLGWGSMTDGITLGRAEVSRVPGPRSVEERCAGVRCPVVVVHGTQDNALPRDHGARLAELTGGTMVTFEGSGHVPLGRDPVAVNRLLDEVLAAATRTPTISPSRG